MHPAPPPAAQPSPYARLAYTREASLSPLRASKQHQQQRRFSHSRGRPALPSASGGYESAGRERSTSTSGWSVEFEESVGGGEFERGRSVSSQRGREGSRAPLWRRGESTRRSSLSEGAAEGGSVEHVEGQREKTERTEWWKRVGRHFLGVRGPRAFPTPLLPLLSPLPLAVETPLLAFLGSFPSILLCAAISSALSRLAGFDDTPLLAGSLGATAVLLYAVPEGPLSQPRQLVGGHTISALIGCITSQLFAFSTAFTTLSDEYTTDNSLATPQSWATFSPVAAALSVSLSILAMQLTGTLHPPGGATALIASFHRTTASRWSFLLVVFLSVSTMGIWALFVMNIGRRRYPTHWWTPPEASPSISLDTSPCPSRLPLDAEKSATVNSPFSLSSPFSASSSSPLSFSPALPSQSRSPDRDLQRRWLGQLGEVDEEALASGGEGEERVFEEEERGRTRRVERGK